MFGEDNKTALDHGWRWFEYHAQQRLTVFKYYLIIMGAIGVALYTLHTAQEHLFAAIAAASGVIASITFFALDHRVSQLVKLGEDLMSRQEAILQEGTGHSEALISKLSNQNQWKVLGSYRRAFRLIFAWAAFALTGATGWEIYLAVCGPTPLPLT
jgi:hypothetical protein